MIVGHNPQTGLERADQAWFESDAASNDEAIREIDSEAARFGMLRVNEYWLQKRRVEAGKVVRRGFCYRPQETDLDSRLESIRSSEPPGETSVSTIREYRAGK